MYMYVLSACSDSQISLLTKYMSVYDASFETEEVTMKNYFLIVFNCIFYFVLKEMNFAFLSTEKKSG